jgi:hypothetical protein
MEPQYGWQTLNIVAREQINIVLWLNAQCQMWLADFDHVGIGLDKCKVSRRASFFHYLIQYSRQLLI